MSQDYIDEIRLKVSGDAYDVRDTGARALISDLDTYKAPLASPTFTGTPAVPTAEAGTNTTQIASTAFVATAVSNAMSSPALTGTPTVPTAEAGTNTTQAASTAFVKTAIDNAKNNTTLTGTTTVQTLVVGGYTIAVG